MRKEQMKTRKSICVASAIAAISLGFATSSIGQEAEGKVRIGDAEGRAKIDLPADNNDTIRLDRDLESPYRLGSGSRKGVGKLNKASGLMGMEVKNHLGESLGEIQDLVIDLPSGRISYVVLSVGGLLGIGEKYLAIPTGVFTPAPEGNKLVINADKAKIQSAPGFAKTSWPSVDNPSWGGFAYWETDGVRSDKSVNIETDANLSRDRDSFLNGNKDDLYLENGADRDRFNRDRNLGNRDRAEKGPVFKGRITAINPETRTMTVTGESGMMTFSFTEKPALSLRNNRNPALTDLRVGFPVVVGYHDEGGSHMAHSVIRSDSPEVK
jgi:sporulation protein YlmC with PRC-barrel domain